MKDKFQIPPFVSHVTKTLQKSGFEAYLVGGCVRDLLIGRIPKDWDITTNATPEEIIGCFPVLKTVYENNFGTVTVLNIPPEAGTAVTPADANALAGKRVTPDKDNQVQVTTYRSEGNYSDFRRPDSVTYETQLEKDLERRDFTMNAIAYDPLKGHIKDIFDGLKDIKDKVIKAVGNPETRFKEDALRLLRTVRFSCQLGFTISHETLEALVSQAPLLSQVSHERIRDEFIKIVESPNPSMGIGLLQKTGLLASVAPEFLEGVGCEQKGAHIYDVFEHLLHALQHAADKGFSTEVRLAALFHDIGKPATRRYDRTKDKYTFFGHEVVGARMTKKVLERLNFSRETVSRVTTLVRNHMFFSDTEKITLSAVRRIIRNVSPADANALAGKPEEHPIWRLMEVRECDRVGMKKKEAPYRLRKYHAMIEEALRDPITVSQLAIDGTYLMNELHMKPGPRMGWILHALLEEVLEKPELNTVEQLKERVLDLDELEDKDLKTLGEKGKERKEEVNEGEVAELHKKHGVK